MDPTHSRQERPLPDGEYVVRFTGQDGGGDSDREQIMLVQQGDWLVVLEWSYQEGGNQTPILTKRVPAHWRYREVFEGSATVIEICAPTNRERRQTLVRRG